MQAARCVGASLIVFFICARVAAAQGEELRVYFNVPAQRAENAVKEVAAQAKRPVLFRTENIADVQTNAVAGFFSVNDALEALFYQTPLEGGLTQNGAIVVSLRNHQEAEGTMNTKQLKKSFLTSVSAFLLGAGGAVAADAENAQGEDVIIVTATKTGEQSLQKTPLAIQAFSPEELKIKNVNEIGDLIQLIPGAAENQTTGIIARSYNIRGVGSSSTNGDSPIGYYLDDVPFSVINFGIAPPVNFVDLEQVEVLRGPQGTLYGQGAAGGTIIFRTKQPNLQEPEAVLSSFVSSTKSASGANFGFDGAVSIPLVKDKLALRVSGSYQKNQGWANLWNGASPADIVGAPDAEGVNWDRHNDIRATLLWQPSDNFKLRAQFWNFEAFQGYNNLFDSLDPIAIVSAPDVVGFSQGDFNLYSVSGELDLGAVTVNSSTSYLEGEFQSLFSFHPSGFLDSAFFPKLFTQELRVRSNSTGPLKWVLGGQFQDGEGPQRNIISLPVLSLELDTPNNTETTNWAVFGEISYDLFDGKLVPLVGLRFYQDERNFDPGAGIKEGGKKDVTTYRVNLSYLPTDNLTIFGTVSTGFRAGIVQTEFQADALLADGIPAQVFNRPDSLRNYELGIKYRTPDNSFGLGVNLYRIEFEDLQFSLNSTSGVGGFANLGDARSNGVDVEVFWRTPLDGLSLSAVGNYNDSEFSEVPAAVQAALPTAMPGGDLIGAAPFNYRFDANYTKEFNDRAELFSNVGYARFGDKLMSQGVYTSKYELLSATLGVRYDNWEVSLYGTNLTDTNEPIFIFAGGGLVADQATVRPRTFGARFRVNY